LIAQQRGFMNCENCKKKDLAVLIEMHNIKNEKILVCLECAKKLYNQKRYDPQTEKTLKT